MYVIGDNSASSTQQQFPESSINELVSKGFGRKDVIEALTKFNGDSNQALVFLLAKAIQVPNLQ